MSGPRFRTAIFAFCYIKECEMAMFRKCVIQLPDPTFDYSSLSNIAADNCYLGQVDKVLPLVKVCRKIATEKLCDIIPPKERLSELERVWAELPKNMKLLFRRYSNYYNIRRTMT